MKKMPGYCCQVSFKFQNREIGHSIAEQWVN